MFYGLLLLKSIWLRTRRYRTFLVVQWLRICLPLRGTWIESLVWEDSTCCWAAEFMRHNYWSPGTLESTRGNKRNCNSEKPAQHSQRGAPAHCNLRKGPAATKTRHSQKYINNFYKNKEICTCHILISPLSLTERASWGPGYGLNLY